MFSSGHENLFPCGPLTRPSSVMDRKWKPNVELAPNCPRCDSSNTKFCYYNNYSLSQPRYFCKGCRRYWTKGGSLRNVPVGGGCRKNRRSKSLRLSSSESCPTSTASPFAPRPLPDPTVPSSEPPSSIDLDVIYSKFLNRHSDPQTALPGEFSGASFELSDASNPSPSPAEFSQDQGGGGMVVDSQRSLEAQYLGGSQAQQMYLGELEASSNEIQYGALGAEAANLAGLHPNLMNTSDQAGSTLQVQDLFWSNYPLLPSNYTTPHQQVLDSFALDHQHLTVQTANWTSFDLSSCYDAFSTP